jgi:hypothetical protein
VTSSRVGASTRLCKFGCHSSVNNLDRLNHYVDCNTIWDVLLTVLLKLHATTWAATRWNLLVVRPQFLDGEFFHQEKLFALAAVVDCFQYVSNQKVLLERFSNHCVSSSDEGPSETSTGSGTDSEAVATSDHQGEDTIETAHVSCSPWLL